MPISADHPVLGFYKMRRQKDGPWLPVAIWKKDNGEVVARVGPDMAAPSDIWTYCAGHKVSSADAKFAFTNKYWPDEQPPSQLSNLPTDPFERLQVEIKEKEERAARLLEHHPEIKNQLTCDLFVNTQKELLGLNKQADALFTIEKKPLLDATNACDEKYRFRARVKVLSERLRSRFETFMKAEQDRRTAEAEAKFQAEHAKVLAERKRLEDERWRKIQSDPVAALTESAPAMPELPLGPEPVKVQAGGGVGRRAGLKTVWVPVIEDYKAVLAYYSEHPDIRAAVDKLVNHVVRDAKGSIVIPGVRIVSDRKVA
jgi:hypothetical protein